MLIIGCDFHTRYQQVAMLDESTGELVERRLEHESGEAHTFYRGLQGSVRVGIEATGPLHWFVRLLAELGHELWIGDSAKIRASEVRKQKRFSAGSRGRRFGRRWNARSSGRKGMRGRNCPGRFRISTGLRRGWEADRREVIRAFGIPQTRRLKR